MTADDRGSRILSDLNSAFRRDPFINMVTIAAGNQDEYDVLPVIEPQKNKSPLHLVEHKVGLELWSVKVLFEYSYNTLLSWRRKDLPTKNLSAEDLSCLSRAVVLVNPDCSTAWNIRKELVLSREVSLIEDLKLGALVFTKHPKSPETFCHRKWLLRKLIAGHMTNGRSPGGDSMNVQNGEIGIEGIDINIVANQRRRGGQNHLRFEQMDYDDIIFREFEVCRRAAERYLSNYNAWSHRIWVVQVCHLCSLQVIFRELKVLDSWVSSHVSDHSGFHYRQFLLTQLQSQQSQLERELAKDIKDLLREEMAFIVDLIQTFPGHEALWYHRKFVFHAIQMCSNHGNSTSSTRYKEVVNGSHGSERIEIRQEEVTLKKTRLEGDSHILALKEIDLVSQCEMTSPDERQHNLSGRYVEWIKQIYL